MGNLKIKQIDPSQIRYTPQDGEVIQTPEGKCLVWYDNEWQTIETQGSGIQMNLYDMNKQIISQLPTLAGQELVDKLIGVDALHAAFENKYYMLYGKEISYFTIFEIVNPRYFADEVLECLTNIGEVKSIESDGNGALEIWVQTEEDSTCLYLFPYDSGIVRVGE